MTFKIDNILEIEAPIELVWEVLTDLSRYGEWNPFVPEASSTFEVGDPFTMKVQLFEMFAQPQTETIFEFEPGKRFRYGVPSMPLGAMASSRCHLVESLGPERTVYRSEFQLDGWLAPLIEGLLGGRMKKGFDTMADALKVRAEGLHGQRNRES